VNSILFISEFRFDFDSLACIQGLFIGYTMFEQLSTVIEWRFDDPTPKRGTNLHVSMTRVSTARSRRGLLLFLSVAR
jgi:hypothetical protein